MIGTSEAPLSNPTLRATVLLAGHGLLFSHLFTNVFDLELLDSARLQEPGEFRKVFVIAFYGTFAAIGMFCAYRALEKIEHDRKAFDFWARRSLRIMLGVLFSLVIVHWYYGWRYVALVGFERAFLP